MYSDNKRIVITRQPSISIPNHIEQSGPSMPVLPGGSLPSGPVLPVRSFLVGTSPPRKQTDRHRQSDNVTSPHTKYVVD